MPGCDGTGPMGVGARTGRGMGYCSPASGVAPGGTVVHGLGRGGRGRGRGRGFGRGAWRPAVAPQPTTDQELQWLRQEAQAMQQGLTDIEQRISELEQAGSDDA